MMKTILGIIGIVITISASDTYADTNTYIADISQYWQRIDVLFESHIPDILTKEREKAKATMPADKVDSYIKYFERGVRSQIGVILITGRDVRRLEIAFREGLGRKALFRHGYSAGFAEKAQSKKVNNASNQTMEPTGDTRAGDSD